MHREMKRAEGWGCVRALCVRDSRELVGMQAASPSPRLPFEQSLPQRNYRFPALLHQLSSHQPTAADLLSIQVKLRQGDAASTALKTPIFPNRRQRRIITAGTNHC